MLNAQFSTLETVLTSLDEQLASVQDSNNQAEIEYKRLENQRALELSKRSESLRTNLPGILQSDVASKAEIARMEPQLKPLAEETRAQVQKLAQAKLFGETVRKIDEITHQLAQAADLEKKATLYQKIRPLVKELGSEPFGSAKDALLDELHRIVAPAKQEALANLSRSLGEKWPSQNPASLEFNEALRIALMLDDNELEGAAMDTFNVFCTALDLRFKFNFESQQKTRRFDKPEWLFAFFAKMIDPHLGWLKNTVQPVVSEVFPEIIAINAFTSALLPSVFRAAKLYLDVCKQDPEMLDHYLQESLKFDQELVDKYYYFFSEDWLGITTTSLVNDESAFQQWLQYEIDSTNTTFSELSKSAGAWNIDYDSTDTKITSRPTVLGLGFSTLFDSVTEMYKHLKLPKLQLRFLNDIQLALIDRYVAFLKHRKNHPQADLDDYGKVIGSLGYFIDFLSHRNSYLTFIDLQSSINSEEALFDEVIQSLDKFRSSCLEEISTMLKRAIPDLFKSYTHKKDHNAGEASHHLHSPVSKLSSRLDFFKEICNIVDYTTIKVNLAKTLGEYLFKSVVQSSTFTSEQGQSLKLDVDFIWTSLDLPVNTQYNNLIASAVYFETGVDPQGLSPDLLSSIQRRRV